MTFFLLDIRGIAHNTRCLFFCLIQIKFFIYTLKIINSK